MKMGMVLGMFISPMAFFFAAALPVVILAPPIKLRP